MFFSYVGFTNVDQRYCQGSSQIYCLAITYLYCFNPYVLELWHGGVYNIGVAITYGLAPYIFFKFNEILLNSFSLKEASKCALALVAASFTFWLFAPLAFGLLALFFVQIIQNRKKWLMIFTNALKVGMLYVPAIAYITFPIIYELLNNASDNNGSFNPTYGNMQGGIWYQILMRHSWAIYTEWFPRSLYPFADHFFSTYYVMSILSLYGLLIVGVALIYRDSHQIRATKFWISSQKHNSSFEGNNNISRTQRVSTLIVPSLTILLVALFLAKGAQQPLGFVFKFLYKYVPLFSVFRTPDIRFGFLIILSICLLYVYISQYFRKLFFVITIGAIVLVSSWPLFSGMAIRGENVPGKFYDRIVKIPQDQKALSSYINQHASEGFYILPIPGSDYGNFALENHDILVGQDLLSKQISQPFIYSSTSGGISKAAINRLNTCISDGDLQCLSDFPIQFILFRNDLPGMINPLHREISKAFRPVYRNPTYILYEITPATSIIGAKDVSLKKINPTNYQISISSLSQDQKIIFRQNYSPHWKIIETDNLMCNKNQEYLHNLVCEIDRWASDVKNVVLNRFKFESTHHECIYYANCWNIKASSEPRSYHYAIIYYPQIYYQLCGIISLLAISLLVIFSFKPSKVDQ